MGKSACIRVIHEAKLAMMQLGERMVDRGVITSTQQIFMLLDSELDDFLQDPPSFVETISERDMAFLNFPNLCRPTLSASSKEYHQFQNG